MGGRKVFIDGREISGKEGMTILEAAEQADIYIPTLCHKTGLSATGVCRICVVEMEGSPTLVGACHTPISDGMVIYTQSPKVLASRKATLEVMLIAHKGPCVTDSRIEQCELQRLTSELEVGPPRFALSEPRFYPVEEVSPYVRRDLSRCILCRRCIKACREIAKKDVYSIGYRGFDSKVIVDCDEPLNKEVCRDCGICIDYCPTSALTRPSYLPEGNEKKEGLEARQGERNGEGNNRYKLLRMLKSEQTTSGSVSSKVIPEIAQSLNISVGEVYGVATFYSFLSTRPLGRNVIRICKSLPCYLKDAPMIVEVVEKALGIGPGQTTADGKFSFELTNCIGACDKAPAMLIDNDVHGNLTSDKILKVLKSYS
ncbi:MAG: NADH-quinone oxidoreductase subunit NuoE [Desulfobacterales bacterium]|nr:NADH-quinone oxidoreductase subunit NuoE [Desulfobacterales bacterium]